MGQGRRIQMWRSRSLYTPFEGDPCTSGAHNPEICLNATRTAKISAAGQVTSEIDRPRSAKHLHKTRLTGHSRRENCDS
jgi:hypothetical protein